MRMKFEAEDPAEVSKNDKQGEVDRSQGAARAISVSGHWLCVGTSPEPDCLLVVHWSRFAMERPEMVQEHYEE